MGKAMRICFIGDSLVSGAFDEECLGWAGRISASARKRGHDVSPYNLGVRGESSTQIARRWRAEAEVRQTAQQEGRLVFEFGVNDVRDMSGKRQMEMAESLASARAILSAAAGWKPTLMVGPPSVGDDLRNGRLQELTGALAALCAELRIPYLDCFAPLSKSASWLENLQSVDGTHPSAKGYAKWAALVETWPAWREWLP